MIHFHHHHSLFILASPMFLHKAIDEECQRVRYQWKYRLLDVPMCNAMATIDVYCCN